MFKKIAITLIFGLILVLGLSFLFLYQLRNIKQMVCYKDKCFQVELARSKEEIERGLTGRVSLDDGMGMLFDFNVSGKYSFWMKDTLIPLDIIWIDGVGKVVYIKESAKPCVLQNCESYAPGQDARYVLEINGGTSEKIGLSVGDKLDLKIR